MKTSLLFIVIVLNCYAECDIFQLSLICNTSRLDGELWWAKDEVNLTVPLEATKGSKVRTTLSITLNTKNDAGDFTCVAKTTEGFLLKRTVHIGKRERPEMISPRRIHDVLVNESVTLACDVIGYPLPVLFWEAYSTTARWKDMTKLTHINETYVKMSIDFESVQHADETKYYCEARNSVSDGVRISHYLKVNDDPAIEWELVFPFGVNNLYFKLPIKIDIDDRRYPYFEYLKNDTEEWRVHTRKNEFGVDGYIASGLERSTWYKFRITFINYIEVFGPVYYKWMKPFEEEPEFIPTIRIEATTLDSIKIGLSETPPSLQHYLNYYEVIASPGNETAEVMNTKFVLKNLRRETNYTLKVRACNNFTRHCCGWSLETTTVTIDRDPKFVPNISKKAATSTSITIGWTSPPLEMRRYVHQYKAIANRWNQESKPVYFLADVNSYIFENLESQARYLIKVAACSEYKTQCGDWSSEREIFTINDEKGTELLIWPSLTVAVVLSIIVGTWISIQKRRRNATRRKMMRDALEQFNAGALDCLNPALSISDQAELLPYNKKWEFPRELLKLEKIIGSGAFGIVRKAQAQSIRRPEMVTTVAVKLVRATARLNYMTALDRELKILGYLGKHLNVVNLLGACTKNVNYGELLVIVEFCRFGNMRDYLIRRRDEFIAQFDTTSAATITASSNSCNDTLENSENFTDDKTETESSTPVTDAIEPVRQSKYQGDFTDEDLKPIETRDLICWIWQVSRGMKFLGSRRVIHGDLAARNILLADHNVVKICDFGMAKALQADEDYKKKGHDPLPVKWMAIESLRDRVFSYQSDIWSFGIVMWEFFSLGATPYPGMDSGSLYQKLKDGFRMERPKYASEEIYYMMQFCWDAEPARRPSFEQLEDILIDLLDESVRKHYLDLGQPYVQMNDDAVAHGEKDYLTMSPSGEATINDTLE